MPSIDAVLPLVPRDLGRFELLARSLARFFTGLGTLHVVVPDAALGELEGPLRRSANGLPIAVVPERLWVPEMGTFRHLGGWYKQQLVKLAAAEFVTSEFYLTLDADVVCTRPVDPDALIEEGRAPYYVIAKGEHPKWYVGAAAALALEPKRHGVLHNVTPCVLARNGVLELLAHLDTVARARRYARGARGIQQRLLFALHEHGPFRKERPWRGWLASSYPWAEYAMYYTFLETTGRIGQYHVERDTCVYDIERSVWWKGEFDRLDPAPLFAGGGPPYFVVIQSNTGVDATLTWKRLEPWLGATGSGT